MGGCSWREAASACTVVLTVLLFLLTVLFSAQEMEPGVTSKSDLDVRRERRGEPGDKSEQLT